MHLFSRLGGALPSRQDEVFSPTASISGVDLSTTRHYFYAKGTRRWRRFSLHGGVALCRAMSDEASSTRAGHDLLGGPARKAATGEIVSAEELGGISPRTSGITDHLVDDDEDVLVIVCARSRTPSARANAQWDVRRSVEPGHRRAYMVPPDPCPLRGS